MSKSSLMYLAALSVLLCYAVQPARAGRFEGDGGGLKGIGGMGGGFKGIGGMGGGFKGIGGMGGGCKGLGGMGGGFRGVGDAGGGFSSLRSSGRYGSWSGRYENMDGGRYENMDGGRYENMDGGRYENMDGGRYGEGYSTSSTNQSGGAYSYSYRPAMEMAVGEAMLQRLRATHRTASFGGRTQGTGPAGSSSLLQAVRSTDGSYRSARVNSLNLNPDSMGGFKMYAE